MIGRLPKPFLDEDLTTTILYHDRLRVVAGLQSRWASRRKITLADLVDEPWCVPSPDINATGSQFADAFPGQRIYGPAYRGNGGLYPAGDQPACTWPIPWDTR